MYWSMVKTTINLRASRKCEEINDFTLWNALFDYIYYIYSTSWENTGGFLVQVKGAFDLVSMIVF